VVIPCRALSAAGTAGVGEKIDRLRAEAGRQARDWAKHGNAFEAIEWETVAKWLGGIK
jgi:hypothetical protein